jgi:hypothetical protein
LPPGTPPETRAGFFNFPDDAAVVREKMKPTASGITMLRNIVRAKLSTNSPEAPPCLSKLDDDLAFCTSLFYVSQSFFGRFEWKDPIYNWPYDPRMDERTDLA